MARFTTVRSDTIEFAFWLTFSKGGDMRLSRGKPSVGRDERAMSCTATLPKSLFSTPTLRATIGIKDDPPGAYSIDIEAAGDALRAVLGCDIDLRVVAPSTHPEGLIDG